MQSTLASGTRSAGSRPCTLLVFAGPTGGHLFPAQAFVESFRQRHWDSVIYLVTSQRGKALTAQIPSGLFREVFYLKEFPFLPEFS